MEETNNFSFKVPVVKHWEEEVVIGKSILGKKKQTQRFIKVAVTGLKEDRDGEMMSQEAIDDMVMQFKAGTIPFFPDHGRDPSTGAMGVYSWKQMMGVWIDAEQIGDEVFSTLRINKSHPDAELLWKYIDEGMPLGFSIGGRPTESPKTMEIENDTKPELTKNEKE